MKKNYTLMIILLISSLLLAATVHAADDTQSYTDPEEDVMDANFVFTDTKPNIDITEVTYVKEGKQVTLTMTVKGKIENRGNLNEILEGESLDIDAVWYSLALTTSSESYGIDYVNQVCNISMGLSGVDSDNFSIEDDTFTVYFDLLDEDETFDSLEAFSYDWKGFNFYADFTTDEVIPLTIDAGYAYEANEGELINFTGIALGGVPPYTWEWDFKDGTTASKQNPQHTYDQAKDYSVVLTVTDSEGTSETATASVTVFDDGTGENGDNNGSSSNNLVLFAVVIGVIAIIGVAVVVVIIRR